MRQKDSELILLQSSFKLVTTSFKMSLPRED